MVDEIWDTDLTKFDSFLKRYVSDLKPHYNQMTKIRCCDDPFKNQLTITNPELTLIDDSELVSVLDLPPSERHHFYSTRTRFSSTARTTFYAKVTTYDIENYENSGLALRFAVVNKISALLESRDSNRPKRSDIRVPRTSDSRDKNYPFADREYDRISIRSQEDGCDHHFYSDIPWEDRLLLKHAAFYPLITLPEFLSGDTFHNRTYNPNKKWDPQSHPPLVSEEGAIMNEEYEVNHYTGDLYSDFIWLDREDDIVSQFIDTRLIRFLAKYEIPIWASICANSLQRPIKDHELKFLDDTILRLASLRDTCLNSMTDLALGVVINFYAILAEFDVLKMCQSCGRIMRHRHNKKFCSFASENRDCGKKKRSKDYYIRNKERLSEYYREEMRKNRASIRSIIEKEAKERRT